MMKRKYLKQKHGWVEKRELLRATKKPYKKPGAWWQKIASNSNMAASTSAGLGGQLSALSAVLPQPAGSQLGPRFVCGKLGHLKKLLPDMAESPVYF